MWSPLRLVACLALGAAAAGPALSASAESAITAAGGTVEKLPLPFKVRPAFHGSAHTNR